MTDCTCARAGFPNSCDNCDGTDGPSVLKWVRMEIFSLCEYTESSAEALDACEADPEQDAFDRGRIFEAKRIRRAIGELIAERLRDLL